MSESSSEQEQTATDDDQQGISDAALPEDLRPAEDNPLADPDHDVGGDDHDDTDDTDDTDG